VHIQASGIRQLRQLNMKIKLFATLKDRAGTSEIVVDTGRPGQPLTVADLRRYVCETCPGLAALVASSIVSVNREFAFNHDTVSATDEVALFPPVSGG